MSASSVAADRPLAGGRVRQVAADYLALTKPKVQSLLLLTTVTTMEVAGSPSAGRIALTCLDGRLPVRDRLLLDPARTSGRCRC